MKPIATILVAVFLAASLCAQDGTEERIIPIEIELPDEDEIDEGLVGRLAALVHIYGAEPDESNLSALIELDHLGDGLFTEAVWWKSDRPRIRKLAFFLMLNRIQDAVSTQPLLDELKAGCARFLPEERDARLAEVASVRRDFKILQQEFKELFPVPKHDRENSRKGQGGAR